MRNTQNTKAHIQRAILKLELQLTIHLLEAFKNQRAFMSGKRRRGKLRTTLQLEVCVCVRVWVRYVTPDQ